MIEWARGGWAFVPLSWFTKRSTSQPGWPAPSLSNVDVQRMGKINVDREPWTRLGCRAPANISLGVRHLGSEHIRQQADSD